MKQCSEILDMLDAYADGELDKQSSRLVRYHVSTCRGCREQLNALQLINTCIRETADRSEPAPDIADSVMANLPDVRRAPVRRFQWAWAACAALLIAFSIWAFSPDHRGLRPAPSPVQMAMAPQKPVNAMCVAYCEAKLAGKAVGPPPPARRPLNAKCAAYCKAKAAGKAVGPPPLPTNPQHPG